MIGTSPGIRGRSGIRAAEIRRPVVVIARLHRSIRDAMSPDDIISRIHGTISIEVADKLMTRGECAEP